MGFFSDIIHDAQRQVTIPVGNGQEFLSVHEANPVFPNQETVAADGMSRNGRIMDSQVWEENDRTSASLKTQPEKSVVRQVMGLSLSEDITAKESPSSGSALKRLSHCGKHELSGVKSARTVPSVQDSGKIGVFSDGSDTLSCSHTATSDEQVKESLSPVQAQGTGKMPMETRWRRSAGSNTRAGSITPSNFSSDRKDKEQRSESTFKANMTFLDKQDGLESEHPFKENVVDTGKKANRVSQASGDSADSVAGQSRPQENNHGRDKPKSLVDVLGTEISSSWPKEGRTTPESADHPSKKSSEPRITIEMLEVTVVSSEQTGTQIRGREKVSSDFTSRLYLRNI